MPPTTDLGARRKWPLRGIVGRFETRVVAIGFERLALRRGLEALTRQAEAITVATEFGERGKRFVDCADRNDLNLISSDCAGISNLGVRLTCRHEKVLCAALFHR